ncbi:hypothetical protein [Atlantibacter hermannii]|uniref:hypothetical protein n=1 Tax=Atlantibacter hermannii TaxID=565 RepID=UPI002FDDA8D0
MAKNERVSDGVIDVWFNAAKVAIHHPATPRSEHSHAFAAYTLAQEVKGLRAELQQYRAAAEPIYQYRLRNGYNGFYTEWQTIKRDQVDFVLKAQPLNAEFRIIAAPQVTSVPTFDDLRDAVAEMTGGIPYQWPNSDKGHQPVPFMNFNSLGRIVDKFSAAPAVQEEQEVKK